MEEKHSSCLWTVFYNFQIKDFVIVILDFVIVVIIVVTIIVIMIAVIVIIAVLIAIVIIFIIVVFIIVVIIVTESSFEVELYPEPWSFYRTNFPWPFTGH